MANGSAAASGALSGAAAGATIGGPWGAAVGGVVGGVAGLFSGGGDDQAKADQQAAIDAIRAVGEVPNLADPIALKHYEEAGILAPDLVQRLTLNADQATTLTENPQNRANQQLSLNALQQMSQNGMSAQDMAQFNQMRDQVAGDTQAKTAQLLQQAQMRGQLGGGDTLAAQLAAAQSGAQSESKQADSLASTAAQARQQALANFGNLSSQVRGQDYATQQYNTQNDILRKQFLDQNAVARQQANVAASNSANMYNTQRQQSVSDANTAAANAESARQKQAASTAYQLKLAKAKGISDVYTGAVKNDMTNAQNSAGNFQNIMGGVTSLAGALGKSGAFDGGGDTGLKMPTLGSSSTGSTGSAPSLESPGKLEQGFQLAPEFKARGGKISGPEVVPGDDSRNDVVPAMLSAGEVVVPKSKAKNPKAAAKFVEEANKDDDDSVHEVIGSLAAFLKSIHEMKK